MDLIKITLKIEASDKPLLEKIYEEKAKRREIEIKGQSDKTPKFIAISNALDDYYIINKLRSYCASLNHYAMRNHKNIGYTKEDFRFIKYIFKEIEIKEFNHPSINIFSQIINLYEQGFDEFEFDKRVMALAQKIKNNDSFIHPDEQVEMLTHLTGLSTKRMNQGQATICKTNFLLMNEVVNVWFGKKLNLIIPSAFFSNITICVLKEGKDSWVKNIDTIGISPESKKEGYKNIFEWAERFIENYGKKLDSQYAYYYPLIKAYCEFAQKYYSKAYQTLKQLDGIRTLDINLNSKVLMLQILYEWEESPTKLFKRDNIDIAKVLEAYRSLIRDDVNRKHQLSYQLPIYKEFHKQFKRLYRFNMKFRGQLFNSSKEKFVKEKNEFKIELENSNLPQKNWLLSSLEQIK